MSIPRLSSIGPHLLNDFSRNPCAIFFFFFFQTSYIWNLLLREIKICTYGHSPLIKIAGKST